MKAPVDIFNERLLVILGLSPETAAIVMERITELEKENAQLRKSAPAAVPGPLEGEQLAHYKSEAEDYYWLISRHGARWLEGYRVDEKTPTEIHEARLQHEALRTAAPASEGKG